VGLFKSETGHMIKTRGLGIGLYPVPVHLDIICLDIFSLTPRSSLAVVPRCSTQNNPRSPIPPTSLHTLFTIFFYNAG
jgi:hypothetical protein